MSDNTEKTPGIYYGPGRISNMEDSRPVMEDEGHAAPAPPATSSNDEKLAFVEGFLLGLARRLDDCGYQWAKAGEAADDCRAVAKMVSRVGVEMARVVQPKSAS